MSTWLITGIAGFIGSHLLEHLISQNQKVIGVDNFFTGKRENIEKLSKSFSFIEGDIRDRALCLKLCEGVDYVLHHAAISSVQFSIENPIETADVNVTGTMNLLGAATHYGVKRFVYASSSAIYGDVEGAHKRETDPVSPISPYASTKYMNELCSKLAPKTVGLRYFNVFGPRQDPKGPYSAVIPKWIAQMASGKRPVVYGNGETTRDFCHVDNVVRANMLACLQDFYLEPGSVFNVASGQSISLNNLFLLIKKNINVNLEPIYQDFRTGDILESSANIDKIKAALGYVPVVSVEEGIRKTLEDSLRYV